jgi:hypothetical protein
MKTAFRALTFLALLTLAAPPASAQASADKKDPGSVIVSIYHAVPGKQLDLLRWLAERDAAGREAGVPAGQLYAHSDGDSWDYISIAPETTKEQDARVDEILKKKGLKTGFAAGLEFRALISTHTDTFATGPTTAAELIKAASGN